MESAAKKIKLSSDFEMLEDGMDTYLLDAITQEGINIPEVIESPENISLDDGMDDYFHGTGLKVCNFCNIEMQQRQWRGHLHSNLHKKKSAQQVNEKFKKVVEIYDGRVATYMYENKSEDELDITNFLQSAKEDILCLIKEELKKHSSVKINFELFGVYIKFNVDEDLNLTSVKSFQTKMSEVCDGTDLTKLYAEAAEVIRAKSDEFQEKDSGWSLTSISHIEININKYQPFKGSSYLQLPKFIANKKACVNVNNSDEYCFKWAVISALCNSANVTRPGSYNISDIRSRRIYNRRIQSELKFDGLEFPLKLSDISIFETLNPNISVNVFGYESEGENKYNIVGPYYATQEEKEHHINMLVVYNEDYSISHYVWIKNISRLVSRQISHRNGRVLICNFCLQHFYSRDSFTQHKNECNKIVSKLPSKENSILKFTEFKRKLTIPFTVYADFECILKDISTCSANPENSSTTDMQHHIPCAAAYYIKCSYDDTLNKLCTFDGENCVDDFLTALVNDTKHLFSNYLKKIKPCLPLNDQQKQYQKHHPYCHICKLNLSLDNRVLDHCHLTGKYRGPAHNTCNLEYSLPDMFPIFFHNFTGYDSHLLVKSLSKFSGDINVIPLNKEKYISISKRIYLDSDENNKSVSFHLRFLDSFRFMSSSLEALASNLSDDNFHAVKSFYSSEESFKLISRKGVFPYDFINSWEKLNVTALPPRSVFKNKLTGEECSNENYLFAKKVWSHFNCATIKDYMLNYLKSDVLILADIFENFRKLCQTNYELDPCQYYTTPGLSWDAMLKVTGVQLDLLTDINMYNFVKQGIRGGLTQCSLRYGAANNKYMPNYDSTKKSKYLSYLDINNLYGFAQSQYLPYSGFKWVNDVNIDVTTIRPNATTGYILEVDLEYPEEVHDLHNDLPFCPLNMSTPLCKAKKLIANLEDKNRYVIHYRNLQQCLRNGLKLKKIHRILEFKQSDWLKTYIDLNTELRKKAKNNFEKDFFKLLNNAVYGKTMEDVTKRKDIRILSSWDASRRGLGARILIAKPNFHSIVHFTDNMCAIQLDRVKITYDKPIYLGFCILDISKLKMYEFHYDYMKPKYGEKLKLNYMDTDSFIYTIETDDFYDDIRKDVEETDITKLRFDTSDYAHDNPYNLPLVNKKVIGLMKDENCGKIMLEFVGLRSKLYSIKVENKNEIKKAKGIKKIILNDLSFHSYRDCLFRNKNIYGNMFIFRSKLHNIYTQKIRKLALSNTDDKRYILDDKISTLAWGHYKLRNLQ